MKWCPPSSCSSWLKRSHGSSHQANCTQRVFESLALVSCSNVQRLFQNKQRNVICFIVFVSPPFTSYYLSILFGFLKYPSIMSTGYYNVIVHDFIAILSATIGKMQWIKYRRIKRKFIKTCLKYVLWHSLLRNRSSKRVRCISNNLMTGKSLTRGVKLITRELKIHSLFACKLAIVVWHYCLHSFRHVIYRHTNQNRTQDLHTMCSCNYNSVFIYWSAAYKDAIPQQIDLPRVFMRFRWFSAS